MKKILALFFIFAFCVFALFAQETNLLYKEKKTFPPSKEKIISIHLCNKEGLESLNVEEFHKVDTLYFRYQPMGTWVFKKKDLEDDIAFIHIKQNGNTIHQQNIIPKYNTDNKLFEVIATYPKSELVLAMPFSFSNELGNSQPLTLPEKFWPNYDVFSQCYTLGAELADEKKYIESFATLKYFLSNKPEVEGLSFHRLVMQILKKDVKTTIDTKQQEFNMLKLEFMKSLTKENLNKLDALHAETAAAQDTFLIYFNYVQTSESNTLKEKLSQIVTESGDLLQKYTDEFKLQKLSIFENGHYSDNRFAFYIDLLTRMLCYTDSIHTVDSLHQINSISIDFFPEQRDRLALLEWLDDFLAGINLLNIIIERDHFVLGEDAMLNLENQLMIEKQPYYEIIGAFNALGSKNIDGFAQNISDSFIKCTDEQLLDLLELQYLSYLATNDEISSTVIEAINKGLMYEKEGNLAEAEQQYTKASMLASNYAPPQFYLGRIYHQKDEKYSAKIYFDRALGISPTYISPMKYTIDFLIEDGNYEQALGQANKALESNPIWFFYYLKAEALYHLEKFAEAGEALNRAIELNGFNFDQYILLGDINKEQNNIEKAREAYGNAGKIDPTNKIFTERMASLKN
ncbi:MAG TPA: tetratricopeptide repeat protein [Candidatus Cloacimonetes bacterium]|nr:tetratricopeptide repeat protein [Candidatus Cloacimonadota bacterium]